MSPTAAIVSLPPAEQARRDAFTGRIFGAAVQGVDLFAMYLGSRLGFYQAMASGMPTTSRQLAAATKCSERYAREWLEQQAVAGIVDADQKTDAGKREYTLPAGHAEVLLDQTSSSYLGFFPRYFIASAQVMPKLLRAYRTGGGVSWGDYGQDIWQAQAEQNRPFLMRQFVPDFVAKTPTLHRRLGKKSGARVADIACGAGWAAIAIAQAYPNVRVDGFDLDGAALRQARANAKEAGVANRVKFHRGDAAKLDKGPYDVITIVEAVHDLSRPVAVLEAARRVLKPDGSLLIVDENVPEVFSAPGTDLDRLFYGFSILACLPNGLADKPSAGTGTVMRPTLLKGYTDEAGFSRFEVLKRPHDFFRFYLVRP